jgi:hypothetical protein
VSADPFAALLAKYEAMHAMRRAHAEGLEDDEAPARMRALAERFPGALREIDRLPLPVIELRIAQLRAGERPGWASTLVAYHGWMRVAFRIKRARPRDADPRIVREWLAAVHRPAADEPSLDDLDEAALTAILRPPEGRLTRWVLGRIARDRGVALDALIAEAFDTGNP